VNLSLGSGHYADAETDAFSDEFATLADLRIFVVAASGNSNDQQSGPIDQDGVASPAADPNVFAVAAVDSSDVITNWSQRGDELDLIAPGVDLVMPNVGGGYFTEDGTSFASPYVAGSAALLKQADPSAMGGDIGSILMSSGAGNRDGDNESGNTTGLLFSRLDIVAALKLSSQRIGRTETLELGRTFDTALDAKGVLHAAFYDTSAGRLLYATRDAQGLWSRSQIVDDSADVGAQLSIAVDNSGKVGIGYFDVTHTALKYAAGGNGQWSSSTLDARKHTGTYPSLDFDINGDAYLAYYKRSGGSLRLAHLDRDSNQWAIGVVDDSADVGASASLDVGEAIIRSGAFTQYDTTVAVAYADSTNGDLKYARIDVDDPAAEWYMSVVDDLDGVTSIDLRLHDGLLALGLQAQIAYLDSTNAQVKYAYRNVGWFTETVGASGRRRGAVQLYFDEDNSPLVAYFQGSKRAVYVAARQSGTLWVSDRLSPGSGLIVIAANDRTDESLLSWLNRARSEIGTTGIV
ncbi:MAG TPA: S8 family serine peptidase, partial [Tepidisphaeraceae bacterium]